MNRSLIIYFVVFFSACDHSKSLDTNSTDVEKTTSVRTKSFSILKATLKEYLEAEKRYRDKMLYDTGAHRKIGDEIRLTLNSERQQVVIFKDTLLNSDETDIREYRYIGQFENVELFVVEGIFWEQSEIYLINKRTGVQTAIWNKPRISPDEKYIANLSMPYGIEGVPNGLQIWLTSEFANQKSLLKHIEIDQADWVPIDFVWETDSALILKVTTPEDYLRQGESSQSEVYYLRLVIN